jgi:hypothetical protein
MSKTDRKKKLAAKKRAIAESVRKGVILASTPKRKKCGRKAEPKGGWGQAGPTPEVKARREALLPNGQGCTDDWVDIGQGCGLLTPRIAEALRRYRGYIRAFGKLTGAPGVSTLSDVRGAPLDVDAEEDAAREKRRLQNLLEAIEDALKQAHWRDADVLESCIRSHGMPTSAQMQRISRAAVHVAEALGV